MKQAMKVSLENIGKRFNRDWIFRKINFEFKAQGKYAITGHNGSGKSTLLQILAGAATHSEGTITYSEGRRHLPENKIFKKVAIAAPSLQLIEEMNLHEFLDFHGKMKGWMNNISHQQIVADLGLQAAAHLQIRYYSSGMKQRVKLAQAIFSDTPLLLLDEPLSNLDEAGISLYYSLIENFCMHKTVIVSSNDKKEYSFCTHELNIKVYK